MHEYGIWQGMRQRCLNPKCASYKSYGGRGVRLCEQWVESFSTFLADMGLRPSLAHSIDRIDVNGHYEPANCRWVTKDVQANNRRDNVRVTVNGDTQGLSEWCRRFGLEQRIAFISLRLRQGMPFIQAADEAKKLGDPMSQKDISSRGGYAAHRSGRAHRWDSAEATAAGRKAQHGPQAPTVQTNNQD